MKKNSYDFSGWATKNDLLCADGRTIRKNAFKDDDGRTVPLVWQHDHTDPTRVIGHAILENRDEGVYAYCSFNNSDMGQHVKELVRHRDVNSLSIYANKLKQSGGDVLHGVIREVSVVLAGANPGAMIEFPIMEHGEESETEAKIWTGDEELELGGGMDLAHADEEPEEKKPEEKKTEEKAEEKSEKESDDSDETVKDVLDTLNEEQKGVLEFLVGKAISGEDVPDDEEVSHADSEEKESGSKDEKTVGDVLKTLNPKQKKVFEFIIASAIASQEESEEKPEEEKEEEEGASHSDDEGDAFIMKKNVFDNSQMTEENDTLTHAQMDTLIKDAKSMGSLKASVLSHSEEYGIEQIDYLMPEYKEASGNAAPVFKKRDTKWVDRVMNGVHHIPFSKFKSTVADITDDEARARGYITGSKKKNEVFTLLRRTTDATTVYKKQKLDRDNMIEITSFDVVAWLKGEMRMMLDEELARAFLVGDGRDSSSEDKINPLNIRPVLTDDDLFVIRKEIEPGENQPWGDALIDAVTYAWEEYQGSGDALAFMTRRTHSKLKLLKDRMGRKVYENDAAIASALGVKDIVFVPAIGDASTVRVDTTNDKTYKPAVIILDLADYTVGADKGGSINMFDDFDIDYNQMKYLIETRCSGALTLPYSAIVIEEEVNP